MANIERSWLTNPSRRTALARVAGSYIQNVQLPGALAIIGSATVLLAAAVSSHQLMPVAPG